MTTSTACPINCVPAELLSAIFEAGVQDDDYGDQEISGDVGDYNYDSDSNFLYEAGQEMPGFQRLISMVCSSWRQLALDTPSLWSKVTISGFQLLERPDTFHAWLWRAKDTPLDISLDLTDVVESARFTERLEEALPALLTYLPRCRSFKCCAFYATHIRLIFQSIPGAGITPKLTTLGLSLYNQSRTPIRIPDGHMPRLKSLILVGTPISLEAHRSLFLNLTRLKLSWSRFHRGIPFVEFQQICHACNLLKSLELRKGGPDEKTLWPNMHSSVIHLPKLTKLSLTRFRLDYLSRFLDCLDFPILEELILTFGSVAAVFGCDPLVKKLCTSLSRPSIHLQAVTLGTLECSQPVFRLFLESMAEVTTLAFGVSRTNCRLLSCLSTPISGVPGRRPLARLHTLKIWNYPFTRIPVLEGALASRQLVGWQLPVLILEKNIQTGRYASLVGALRIYRDRAIAKQFEQDSDNDGLPDYEYDYEREV